METSSFEDRVLPMAEACGPLGVIVTARTVGDKYYIDFDGSSSYPEITDWDKYWVTFSAYVELLIQQHGFKNNGTTFQGSSANCTVFVGSLFDFLTVDKPHQSVI